MVRLLWRCGGGRKAESGGSCRHHHPCDDAAAVAAMDDDTRSAEMVDAGNVYQYQQEISQMVRACRFIALIQMFVSTEMENPSPQVTRLIEDIVRNQVVEMVRGVSIRADLDFTVSKACAAARLAVPCAGGSHFPNPLRPGQGQSAAQLLELEGRAQECERVWWRCGRGRRRRW